MQAEGGRMKTLARIACALLPFILHPSAFILSLAAQEPPAPKKHAIRIQFLPPPMEGTISLGIYDARGKLIRTLHREADKNDLTVAVDGLVTTWDGKDDAGSDAPAGKYRAQGFVVGEIAIDGEAFHFNDWIDGDDSPRVRRVIGLSDAGGGRVNIHVTTADGTASRLRYDLKNDEWKDATPEIPLPSPDSRAPVPRLELTGTNATKQIFTLDQDVQMQRVRAVETTLREPLPPENGDTHAENPASGKLLFEKTIRFSDELAQMKDKLKLSNGKPFVPAEKIPFILRPNPLHQDKPGSAEISAGFDANGSFLKTADGLVLRAVSETKALRWIAIGRAPDGKSIVLFQSDGAVVEQFKATGVRDMMAFDAGTFDFDPAKQK